jgi:hypothetical protein
VLLAARRLAGVSDRFVARAIDRVADSVGRQADCPTTSAAADRTGVPLIKSWEARETAAEPDTSAGPAAARCNTEPTSGSAGRAATNR